MTPRVAVIDYGAGNLRSICRALTAAGLEPVVTTDPDTVADAAGVVLPGVGAAGAAMAVLRERGLVAPLRVAMAEERPFLGVCLGMQLLFGHQAEGDTEGLGLFQGQSRLLGPGVKVPQIGWNRVRLVADGPLGPAGTELDAYFVHSYVAVGVDPADVVAVTIYGDPFPSLVARGPVWGTQFHPEKSGAAGLAIVRAWADRVRAAAPLAAGAAARTGEPVPA